MLNPKSMTGQKLQMAMGNFTYLRTGTAGAATTGSFSVSTDREGPVSITVNGERLDDKLMAEAMAKAKESGHTVTYDRRVITTDGPVSMTIASGGGGGVVGGMIGPPTAMRKRTAAPGQSLGKQMIEGVNAEGTRSVMTIEAGEIGNDRPIAITIESWYSDELQAQVMSKRTDPRTGDETFRMTNIRKGEPGSYLFQPPSGYQINERK